MSACQFATLDRSLWRSLQPSAGDPTTTHVYRGQSVGIDVAPDGISTSSKDDPVDCALDIEKASLHDDVDGLDRSSPMKYRSGSVDTEVDEDEWVLLDCHFGVPLFDADVNQSVCRRIAKYGLCNQSRYFTAIISLLFTAVALNNIGLSR